jgi:hypothetical protein
MAQQYFNGTVRFTVEGSSCTAKYFGPADPHQMPWSMILVDPNATFNRTEHDVDGFKVRPPLLQPAAPRQRATDAGVPCAL